MIEYQPGHMYKRTWNPNSFEYEYKNFQTGEGLYSNLKAFGRKSLASAWSNAFDRRSEGLHNVRGKKSSRAQASDLYKQKASDLSKKTADSSFKKFRESRPTRNGKDKIFRKLIGRSKVFDGRKKTPGLKNKSTDVDKLSQRISKRLLLLDDD